MRMRNRLLLAVNVLTSICAVAALAVALWTFKTQLAQTHRQVQENSRRIDKVSTVQNATLCPLIVNALKHTTGPHDLIIEGDPTLAHCIEQSLPGTKIHTG